MDDIRLEPDFHVFLSHNSKNKPAVRELGEALKAAGLRVWLDEWELRPGQPWQPALEKIISTVKAAAVVVGADGLGPWEIPEMYACLSQFINRKMSVIPVLLPGAPCQPELPMFLTGFTWVDLRAGLTHDGVGLLRWGITGEKPETHGQPGNEKGGNRNRPAPPVVTSRNDAPGPVPPVTVADEPPEFPRPPIREPEPKPPVVANVEYWKNSELPILLLISCADRSIAQRVQQRRHQFDSPLPVFHTGANQRVFTANQKFRFDWQAIDPAQILPRVKQFLEQSDPRLLVIVSDALVVAASDGRYEPSQMAKEIRSCFLSPSHLCGMVGLVQGLAQRTSDIDRMLDARAINDSSFIGAVTRVADGLRLKAPPGPARELSRESAMIVQVAQSEVDMEACLQLRHLIYDRMGYLDDDISNCAAQLELDCYDCYYGRRGAIHLVAKVHGEDEVAGTVRLVMAREVSADVQKSVIGSSPKYTMEAQAKFIRQILVKRDPTGFLRQRLNATYFATLPILQSTEFSTKGRDILKAAGDAAELSRLVVAPMYRGLGVSKLLARISHQ